MPVGGEDPLSVGGDQLAVERSGSKPMNIGWNLTICGNLHWHFRQALTIARSDARGQRGSQIHS